MITVVDAGTGNLRSVQKAVQFVAPDQDVRISADVEDIRKAERVVLPGQGAINSWMAALEDSALEDAIRYALANVPVLGICLGLQALFERSEEAGGVECMNLLKGSVRHFNAITETVEPKNLDTGSLKIPHMGWNEVQQQRSHAIWQGIDSGERFYFVHSYFVDAQNERDVAGTTDYGASFTAAVAVDNVFATQFHPEKSADAGLRLLKNFCAWNP